MPQGKLPWFITASQTVATQFGRTSDKAQENGSVKSSESQRQFRGGSRDSDQELDTVVVISRDPRDEKVLQKL
jgi:AGZA family xanthine/uracil permease-like MFS transporter